MLPHNCWMGKQAASYMSQQSKSLNCVSAGFTACFFCPKVTKEIVVSDFLSSCLCEWSLKIQVALFKIILWDSPPPLTATSYHTEESVLLEDRMIFSGVLLDCYRFYMCTCKLISQSISVRV